MKLNIGTRTTARRAALWLLAVVVVSLGTIAGPAGGTASAATSERSGDRSATAGVERRAPAAEPIAVQPAANRYRDALIALVSDQANGPGNPEFSERFLELWHAWYTDLIRPQLAGLGDQCRTANAVVDDALEWARLPLVLGVADDAGADSLSQRVHDDTTGMINGVIEAFGRCYAAAARRCVAAKDPFQAEMMLWILRQLEKLGASGGALDAGKIDACLTFELEFDSLFSLYSRSAGRVQRTWHARTRVQLIRDPAAQATGLDSKFIGEATATLTHEWGGPPSDCYHIVGTEPSTFKVVNLQLHWERDPAADPAGPPTYLNTAPRPALLFDPGVPKELLADSACSGHQRDQNFWAWFFELMHGEEATVHGPILCDRASGVTIAQKGPSGTYLTGGDWERGEGGIVAQRRYSRTVMIWGTCRPSPGNEMDVTESTTLTVRHVPR